MAANLTEFPAGILPLPEEGSEQAKADVVIAGAGPVGLFLGVLLKQADIDVAILDPHLWPGQASKAAVTMPRSFEQLELGDVGRHLGDCGRPVTGFRICLGGGSWTGEFTGVRSMPEQSRQPPRTVGQNFVEQALTDRFLELGGRLYRACKFKAYTEAASGVEVEVERFAYVRPPARLPEELPERLRAVPRTKLSAKYLVGCDGKQSAVRVAMGVPYVGHEYKETFLLSDVEVPQEQIERLGYDRHNLHLVSDATAGATILFVHLQDERWRTYFCQKGLTRAELTPNFLRAKWQQLIPPPGPFEPSEFKDMAFFETSCKLAEQYRRGRVFLAGDACHCHSPAGGQGMNTGLQDAANLAWKLATVVQGRADEKVLDSYEAERMPIAQWVLQTSDVAFRGLTTQRSSAFSFLRRLTLKAIFSLVSPAKLPPVSLRGKMFGLTHSYASSGTCRSIGTGRSGSVAAGDRLPDQACRKRGTPEGEVTYTLDLLRGKPYNAFRVILVAETSQERLAPSEVETCLDALAPLLQRGALVPAVYMGPRPSEALPDMIVSATATPEVAALTPRREDAPEQVPCAELCTRLGLRPQGRALLVVRPDGYIAVLQRGSWEVPPVVAALSELGLLGPPPVGGPLAELVRTAESLS